MKIPNKIKTWQEKRKSLRGSMISMLLLGWFFPLLLMFLLVFLIIAGNVNRQVENAIMASTEKAMDIWEMQIADCETASKNASYLNVIREGYERYKKEGNKSDVGDTIKTFMAQQYKYNSYFRAAALILVEEPDQFYYTYNNSTGASYKDLEFFIKESQSEIMEIAGTLDTATALVNIGGRIYMVRNLVESDFNPFAVLVMELNQESLMESFSGIWGCVDVVLYQDGKPLLFGVGKTGEERLPEDIREALMTQDTVYRKESGSYSHVYRRSKLYGQTIVCAVTLDNSVVYAEMRTIQYFFLILCLFMIPLIVQIMRFFHKKVTIPVKEIVRASEEVEKGNFGIQIENKADSEDFYYMQDSFNHMSTQLKNQFEKIYREEIALRDAKIMALQSQINPHFLNNTMEIINWEARINQNYKISAMIEALSTMLEATMNRKAQEFHSLAEEFAYVDAYLYIISQRFGEKFKHTRQVDESLLQEEVPRLIIQPIVENAVEHGMDIRKQGRIEIRLYKDDDGYLHIDVEDNGKLTDKDRAKIDKLLSQEPDVSKEQRISLGIRNVDQRLKIIYGKSCGLFITSNEKNHTVSTLLLKIDKETEQ